MICNIHLTKANSCNNKVTEKAENAAHSAMALFGDVCSKLKIMKTVLKEVLSTVTACSEAVAEGEGGNVFQDLKCVCNIIHDIPGMSKELEDKTGVLGKAYDGFCSAAGVPTGALLGPIATA